MVQAYRDASSDCMTSQRAISYFSTHAMLLQTLACCLMEECWVEVWTCFAVLLKACCEYRNRSGSWGCRVLQRCVFMYGKKPSPYIFSPDRRGKSPVWAPHLLWILPWPIIPSPVLLALTWCFFLPTLPIWEIYHINHMAIKYSSRGSIQPSGAVWREQRKRGTPLPCRWTEQHKCFQNCPLRPGLPLAGI